MLNSWRNNLRENLHRAFAIKDKLGIYNFAVFRPGGNDTGLISGIIRDTHQKRIIAATLQEIYPNIEQVGFINPDPKNAELMMAGGEFCGNAASSAAYQILAGKKGKIFLKVSGTKKKLIAGVTDSGEGFSQMPVYSDPSYIEHDKENPRNALIRMEGITHYIDFNMSQIRGLTVDEIKLKARKEMAQRQIDKTECCGIIYVDQRKDWCAIHPIVYIRDVDTLYYETACGSGTTALGLLLAQKAGKSIREVSILQPSGLHIKVSVEFDGEKFGYVHIQSKIKKLQEGMFEASLDSVHDSLSTSKRILRSLIKN